MRIQKAERGWVTSQSQHQVTVKDESWSQAFSFHSSVLSLYQILSLIPESREFEWSCYSNNKALLFNGSVTIHFLLKSDRSILND